ncbi:unnamed protein product [Pleuronectes platessa]|uniref:Uncharacterized protein n=1 Tax=Pleuronectes platessa TaxID=8262 RepID=A0A9N7Z2I4_PLEPL|nr:unnamed protein product [Pleuronectes platessa]
MLPHNFLKTVRRSVWIPHTSTHTLVHIWLELDFTTFLGVVRGRRECVCKVGVTEAVGAREREDEDGPGLQLQSQREESPPTGNQLSTPHGLLSDSSKTLQPLH